MATERVLLGGGCFWCVEAAFRELQGIVSAVSGYAGGHVDDPSYEQVCGGATGHAEVVEVTYDPQSIPFREVLEVFFSVHDPTTKDRQGNDVGTQYRSVVYATTPEQARAARELVGELDREGVFGRPVVTELAGPPAPRFWPAEDYHQDYFARNPYQGYCMAVIRPKLAKFRKTYAARLKQAA